MKKDSNLCLNWPDFQANVINSFQEARQDGDFCDVTLVSKDGQGIEAHKIILSASSVLFKSLLKRSLHPHPVVLFNNLQDGLLTNLLYFIYNGEVNIYEEDLMEFLSVASDFKIKGIGDVKEQKPDLDLNEYLNMQPEGNKRNYTQSDENTLALYKCNECKYCGTQVDNVTHLKSHIKSEHKEIFEKHLEELNVSEYIKQSETINYNNLGNENQKAFMKEETSTGNWGSSKSQFISSKSFIIPNIDQVIIDAKVESMQDNAKIGTTLHFICKTCQSFFTKASIFKEHAESHIENLSFKCSSCEYESGARRSLRRHLVIHSQKYQSTKIKQVWKSENVSQTELIDNCDENDQAEDLFNMGNFQEMKQTEAGLEKEISSKNKETEDKQDNSKSLNEKDKTKETPYKWHYIVNGISLLFYSNVEKESFKTKIESLYQRVGKWGERYYRCNICQKERKKNSNCKDHVETHIEGLQFKCSLCHYGCVSSRLIRNHFYKHNPLE